MNDRRFTGKMIGIIVALLLVALLGLGQCGCDADHGANGGTTEAVTTKAVSPEDAGYIAKDGKALYTAIRAEEASEIEKAAATMLVKQLRESVKDFPFTTDFILNRELTPDSEEIAAQYEIVVGRCNRPECADAADGLGSDEWRISVSGHKIVICGGSDRSLYEGCTAFAERLDKTEDGCLKFTDGTVSGKYELSSDMMVILADQKTSCVEVYSIWNCGKVTDAVWRHQYPAYNIADARLREYGGKKVVCAAYGGSGASVVDYETDKTLFVTNAAPDNPHACELVPADGGYVVAVAGSDGSAVRFFNMAGDGNKYASVSLADAHGALYDPELGIVWAQGGNVLTAYEVHIMGDGSVNVKERTEYRTAIPSDNAHDLQPVYGDRDSLWITTSKAVYKFSKNKKTFSTDYEGANRLNRSGVKGVGNFENGTVVWIYPDESFKTWNSQSFYAIIDLYGTKINGSFKVTGSGSYKIRPFISSYN